MFSSNCLVSKKGPLGAIWVAAYFFKKLKKSQIFETDISSSVDNILQDQLEILAYRVLAYLLLGVVRIYSKKVEYLFDDCQEVLVKINEFVDKEKSRAKEAILASCFSITRPVTFDLDAFDLEVLEDTSRDNVVLLEEITLKDVSWKNTGIRQYLGRFAPLDDEFLMDYASPEDLPCHTMDFETEAGTSHCAWNSEASTEKLQFDESFNEEVSHLKTVCRDDELSKIVEASDKNDREQTEVPDMSVLEKHMDQEASMEKCNDRVLSEACENHHSEAEEDPLASLRPLAEDEGNREGMKGPDLSQSENEMHVAMEEDQGNSEVMNRLDVQVEEESSGLIKPFGEEQTNAEKMKGDAMVLSQNEVHQVSEEDSNLEAGIEMPQAEGFSHVVLEKSFPVERPPGENVQTGAEQVNLQATMTSEDGKHSLSSKNRPFSVTLYTTPQTKLQNASGAITPHFTPIRTPAIKERTRFSRKRKCFYDELIVFPNNIIRQWIKDASNLVSKRRKVGCTATSKNCLIFNLPQSFAEASVPCTSELNSLYCGKRLSVLESVKILKTPENTVVLEPPPLVGQSFVQAEIAPEAVETLDPPDNLNLSECPLFDRSSEQAVIAPQTPVQPSPTPPGAEQTEIDPQTPVRPSPPLAGTEQTEIAPQTPVLMSKSARTFGSPENLRFDYMEDLGPSNVNPSESTETLSEIGSVEKEPSLSEDEDSEFNLDIHSNEDDKQGQGDSWSTRTRMVAKYLQKRFLNKSERGKEEQVKLSLVLGGRTKKASARLFYEILVLKTKGLVNVSQDAAFGDILVKKAPQWEQTYRTDGK